MLLAEAEAATKPPAAPAATISQTPGDPGISFRNMRAVGVSIGVAAATFIAMAVVDFILPVAGAFAAPLVLALGGFMAAVLYAKRTHQPLSGGGGARLGWMTGIWFFLGFMIIATIMVTVLSGPLGSEVMHQMQANPQFAKVKLPDPNEIASLVLKSSVEMFFFAVLFPIFGGVVGARYASRHRSRA